MTVLYAQEIRDMTAAEREAELDDLKTELLNARAVQAAGGAPENPGRISELKKAIARVKTIQREEGDVPTGASEPASGETADSQEDE